MDESKQKNNGAEKESEVKKTTALIMKSVSLEIEARQLLLNQFKTNKSVRLRD